MKFKNKEILTELQSHIQERSEELRFKGLTPEKAQKQAAQEFGQLETVYQQVKSIKGSAWLLWLNPKALLLLAYCFLTIALLIIYFGFKNWLVGTIFEPLLLYWAGFSIVGGTVIISYWLIEFLGLGKHKTLWVTILFIALLNLPITAILDIDNFEVNVHAMFLGITLILLSRIFWPKLTIWWQKIIIYSYAIIATTSILREKPLFNFIGKARCLFLTPDNVPLTGALASCQQVQPWSGMLLPVHLTLLIGVPYFFYFLIRYWLNRGTQLYRKVILSCSALGLIMIPIAVGGINNYGQLDIIPWKAEIYQIYHEVLGRDPTAEDIEFYATTRAYQHLDLIKETLMNSEEYNIDFNQAPWRPTIEQIYWDILGRDPRTNELRFYAVTRAYQDLEKVKQVLYQSTERRIKINLIFEEVLNRPATEEELDFYIRNKTSIENIYQALRTIK